MTVKKFYLKGLDCPHCGEKIKREMEKLPWVEGCELDFINKKLIIQGENEVDFFPKAQEAVKSIEPDVEVIAWENYTQKAHDGDKIKKIKLCLAAVSFAASFIFHFLNIEIVSDIFAVLAYIIAGYDVIISAVGSLIRREAFDESLLMTIATVGALLLKEFREGAAVMLFFQIGEFFQDLAVERSKKSIEKLMELKPKYANVIRNSKVISVSPQEVSKGEIIAVKPGERVALDGKVVKGESQLDTSALTGEFVPVEVGYASEVLSGSVNLNGYLEIEVTKEYEDTTVAKIIEMVQNASEKKAPTEKFITKFARIYTPAVVAAALLLVFVPSIFTGFTQFKKWLYRGLLFLVVSCPCALVVSVPLGFFSAIGGASRKGILIKGSKSLEALAKCRVLAADKTGTLTKGEFSVKEISPAGITSSQLLEYAAYCEFASNHPIGRAIVERYSKTIDQSRLRDLKEQPGIGVSCVFDGKKIVCAGKKYIESLGIKVKECENMYTVVYVCAEDKYVGEILLGDELKENSVLAVKTLKEYGIETVMLTGDKKDSAQAYAKQLGISRFFAELLPQEKVSQVEQLIKNEDKATVAFAGDGINDAPVIASADVGIAMGGIGSDIAVEAADIVIINDDVKNICLAVKIASKAMAIVKENIIFALAVKFAVMILGALGFAGMWAAVFADVGVTLLAVLNSLRASKV